MNAATILLACATCYGAADAAMTRGMNAAILTLLGITGVVLGGIIAAIVCLVRRARRYHASEAILENIPKGLPQTG